MSRSGLDEPGVPEELAELLAAGASRKACAEHFGKHKDTIRSWAADPRVVELTRKIRQTRVDEIVQKVDAALHARLQHADKLSVRDLIQIRDTFEGESNATGKRDDQSAAEELWDKMADDPAFAQRIASASQG